jgi:uncharacterized protein
MRSGLKYLLVLAVCAAVLLSGQIVQPGGAGAVSTTLVVNEIDYDQPSTDTAEFVEIKNVSGATIDLDPYQVLLINGTGGGAAGYATIELPAFSLAAGDYYVICANTTTVANCDLDSTPDTNFIQNGNPDALAIRLSGAIVDTVSYGGVTGAPYTETAGAPTDTAEAGSGISRCPDGGDTDNNSTDFALQAITPGSENAGCPEPIDFGVCGDGAETLIHDIQGNGAVSPEAGNLHVIEGEVTAAFQSPNQITGYFVQEEDADFDPDDATSEGIYVVDNANLVSTGDVVRVLGSVAESFGNTQLQGILNFAECASPAVASTAVVDLPAEYPVLEQYEGMLITVPSDLYIAEYFDYDRFGEIVLTSERQFTPTAIVEPGGGAAALLSQYFVERITLDDGRGDQNPDRPRHPNGAPFSTTNRFRGGDVLNNVTGVLQFAFGDYRVQPTAGAAYTPANPRPEVPAAVGGTLKVASFNVLNYFTTLTSAGNVCGPTGGLECRGADNPDEFSFQHDKIIAALTQLNADVVGLIEIENGPADLPTASLVVGLNSQLGAGTYSYIATGGIGTDAIRQAIIYKPAEVEPVGSYAILNSSVDSRFIDTLNRPVLAQTFRELATGEVFTVAVNHLKSKGSDCNAVGDPDTGDGSGNCNLTRVNAALALVDWLAGDPTGSGDPDFLVIGDLNSYDKETPIDVIKAGPDDAAGTGDDFQDLVSLFGGELAYSYVFDGQLGYLDHALSNLHLAPYVSGVTEWHINADEPDIFDYNTDFDGPIQAGLRERHAFRSSDHDAILVGLALPIDEDDCKLGGWQNLARFDGTAFKNQGDCVQFAFTGK